MSAAISKSVPLFDYAVAAAPLQAESPSGDLYVVAPNPRGAVVAVVDGMGHGVEAATAARCAVSTIEAHADESPMSLLRLCHERLRHTRGAVVSMASFDGPEDKMTWLGVGNVECSLLPGSAERSRKAQTIVLRPGVVGYRLPLLRATDIPIAAGDLLIMTTDGIRSGLAHDFPGGDSPAQIADYILSNYSKGTDDSLVFVMRYRGAPE